MTFREVFYNWIEERAKSVKPNSIKTYSTIAEKYVLPQLGELESVSQLDVERMQAAILAAGKSKKTAFDCANMVKTSLNYAARQGWCALPSWNIESQGITYKQELSLISPTQQRRFLEYLADNRSPRTIGYYLAVTTGITMKEMCDLTWQDIDYDNLVRIYGKYAKLHTRKDMERMMAVLISSGA